MADPGITALAFFSDLEEVPGTYTAIKKNINEKGKELYLAYERGTGPGLTNLVFFLAWAEPSKYYTLMKKDLNQGTSKGIPFHLAYTTQAEEGDKAIIGLDVLEAGKTLPSGWTKVDLDLNVSVDGAAHLNLIYQKATS